MGEDSVWLIGEQIQEVSFGLVDNPIGDIWNHTSFDALFGLGFPTLAEFSQEMPLMQMRSQGLIDSLSFSFYMPFQEPGYLVIGGVDYSLNASEFTYHDVVLPSYWLIQLDSIAVKDPNTENTNTSSGPRSKMTCKRDTLSSCAMGRRPCDFQTT